MAEKLVNVLWALMTLVASAIHGHDPRIKSWDGTTINVEWNGSAYKWLSATIFSNIGECFPWGSRGIRKR